MPYTWFGSDGSAVNVTQNSNGSVTIAGGGNTYNGQLATAVPDGNGGYTGEVFGGGLYVQATISVSGATSGLYGSSDSEWPSFWSNTIAGYLGTGTYIEPDFMEMDEPSPGQYEATLHDQSIGVATGTTVSTGADLSQANTYGFLWVPATATSQGYADWYFNGQIVKTVTWSQGDPDYGQLDNNQLVLILGAGANSPMIVSDVEVWQASTAGDSVNGSPAPVIESSSPGGSGGNSGSGGTSVTPSSNNTIIPAGSIAAITDASGNQWTITAGGQVAVNGVADTTTNGVIELAYENGLIWQENSADLWWSETSPGAGWEPPGGTTTSPVPAAAPTASPDNTVVPAGSTAAITDASGNQWTITAGGQVAVNGVADATTNGVIELAYENGLIWQENSADLWWSETSPGAGWEPPGGTATSPVPAATPTATLNTAMVPAGSTAAITDTSGNQAADTTPSVAATNVATAAGTPNDAAGVRTATDHGATFNLTAPGAAKVTLGGTSHRHRFIGTSTAGKAAPDATGGAGRDSHVHNSHDAQLTIKDFSTTKGGTRTLDSAIKGSLVWAADGHDGTLLPFDNCSTHPPIWTANRHFWTPTLPFGPFRPIFTAGRCRA